MKILPVLPWRVLMNREQFKTLRKKYKMSQYDVAWLLGVHKNSVSGWETGKNRLPDMAVVALQYYILQMDIWKREGRWYEIDRLEWE